MKKKLTADECISVFGANKCPHCEGRLSPGRGLTSAKFLEKLEEVCPGLGVFWICEDCGELLVHNKSEYAEKRVDSR